ncbi:CG15625 [Drosophila busckii]|uniref:CG15625 n=1 Tax=Drosophila busckii TaxID=30019 RepID=A0A0M3QSY2_DROBS|nr:CG15625 [Drosophila busckii]ALC38424.1 CG15625 [Drosophila busckii]
MPYLYGIADTKFLVKKEKKKRHVSSHNVLPTHKFQRNALLEARTKFDHNAWPIQFRATPAPLVELCAIAVDKLPLPSIFEWDDMDIRRWIKRYGYPQYMNTFRVNMVSGRKLLLLDASALSAMNIKRFDHIKHISYGIRMLFHFELTKFSSSISLPDEKPNELYLLWHTQTGLNYDAVRRSDLYRRMQLIRERSLNLDHWDLLDLWLRRERERKYKELVGLVPRHNLFECLKAPVVVRNAEPKLDDMMCPICIPPCECEWTERDVHEPWRLSCLTAGRLSTASRYSNKETNCTTCIPPCECRWPSRYYLTGTVIRCLQQKFPEKFSPIFDERFTAVVRPSLVERWTRFSI